MEDSQICVACKQVFEDDMMVGADEEEYCEDCWNERFFVCEACNIIDYTENAREYDTDIYCETCWNERYATCMECGDTYAIDDIDSNRLCPGCGTDFIYEYSYQPQWAYRKEAWENTLYLGWELEIQTTEEEEYAKDVYEQSEHLFCKHDSSIGGGFEIVSHPATYIWYQRHEAKKIKKLLQNLQSQGCTSYDAKTCGLHIHMNRDFFTTKEIQKIQMFFCKNHEFIKKFSKRTNNQIIQWCAVENFNKDYITQPLQMNSTRYTAVNITTYTIEIRVFRGTLRWDRFQATLQFCDALAHFVKIYSIVCFTKSNWQEFCKYLHWTNRYQNLIRYLKEEGLCV